MLEEEPFEVVWCSRSRHGALWLDSSGFVFITFPSSFFTFSFSDGKLLTLSALCSRLHCENMAKVLHLARSLWSSAHTPARTTSNIAVHQKLKIVVLFNLWFISTADFQPGSQGSLGGLWWNTLQTPQTELLYVTYYSTSNTELESWWTLSEF